MLTVETKKISLLMNPSLMESRLFWLLCLIDIRYLTSTETKMVNWLQIHSKNQRNKKRSSFFFVELLITKLYYFVIKPILIILSRNGKSFCLFNKRSDLHCSDWMEFQPI